MEEPRLVTVRSITHKRVYNREGEPLGEIKDAMIDLESGGITYAALSVGGFLGVGDRLFAVPWTSLDYDDEADCFILDAHKDRLDEAPGFNKSHWPSLHGRRYSFLSENSYGRSNLLDPV